MNLRLLAAWLLAAAAFPPAGLIAWAVAGPADALGPALVSGAIAGSIIGLAYGLALQGRDLRAVALWAIATSAGLAAGLALAVSLVGIPEPGPDVLVMGLVTGGAVGLAQAFLRGTAMAGVAWFALIAIAWSAGWWVTASVGVDLTQGWPVFGATGAITAQVISGVAMLVADRAGRPAAVAA
jgi:hypothetical protein